MIASVLERLASLPLAQQEVATHHLRELFAEYRLSLILHWNKPLHAYELRARTKPGGYGEEHVTQLRRFVALSEEERRMMLARIEDDMYP